MQMSRNTQFQMLPPANKVFAKDCMISFTIENKKQGNSCPFKNAAYAGSATCPGVARFDFLPSTLSVLHHDTVLIPLWHKFLHSLSLLSHASAHTLRKCSLPCRFKLGGDSIQRNKVYLWTKGISFSIQAVRSTVSTASENSVWTCCLLKCTLPTH